MTDTSKVFERLVELGSQLPPFLESDWQNTNHFELTTPRGKDFWWLILRDVNSSKLTDDTEEGKRIGLLMDIAKEVRQLIDAGILK